MPTPTIRRLYAFDRCQIVSHFQRLDPVSNRARFGARAKPIQLRHYSSEIFSAPGFVFGVFPDGDLRAVAELRPLSERWPRTGEVAFSVERNWQDRGIGDALLTHILTVAQNRGFCELLMLCLPENRRMQHLARKNRAKIKLSPGQVEARLATPWPTPISITEELVCEYHAFAEAMFLWPR